MSEIDWRTIQHNVKPRNERRMLVEVDVAPVLGIGEFGQHIKPGKSVLLIYKSELAKLERLTQTETQKRRWADAVETFKRRLAVHTAKIKDPQARRIAESEFGESPSSVYFENFPDEPGVPPIVSYRVIDADVPPPETPENLQANQFAELTSALARAIGMGQQPAKAR